jgi:hypothetical protein
MASSGSNGLEGVFLYSHVAPHGRVNHDRGLCTILASWQTELLARLRTLTIECTNVTVTVRVRNNEATWNW